MNIYVALTGGPAVSTSLSFVLGAFSHEDKARAACQDDQDEHAVIAGTDPAPKLVWPDDEANAEDGRKYAVVLVDLDLPV